MTKTNDVAEAIIMERTLDAPVAKVWKALTDVDQMREWYFDLKEFKPEIGFEFEFVVEHEGNHLSPPLQSHRSDSAKENRLHLAIQRRAGKFPRHI